MRLDVFLTENGYYSSRNKAAEAIERGEVTYNGKTVKPSKEISDETLIKIEKNENSFVSNGGYKLDKILRETGFDCKGLTFADLGASNGGFTDCLIKRGAAKVYCVDVGESQLDKSLENSGKVVIMDNTNARYLDKNSFPCVIDAVTADLSFISLELIIPSVKKILKSGGTAFLLIKPQFECGREYLNKNGLVTSVKVRKRVVEKIYNFSIKCGFLPIFITTAPLRDKKNVEYVIMLENNENVTPKPFNELFGELYNL